MASEGSMTPCFSHREGSRRWNCCLPFPGGVWWWRPDGPTVGVQGLLQHSPPDPVHDGAGGQLGGLQVQVALAPKEETVRSGR